MHLRTPSSFRSSAFAMIVGITDFMAEGYADRPLPHAENDAKDLAMTLRQRLGWHSDHLHVLTGPVSKQQIGTELSVLADKIERASRPSLFLLYISTHGHPY